MRIIAIVSALAMLTPGCGRFGRRANLAAERDVAAYRTKQASAATSAPATAPADTSRTATTAPHAGEAGEVIETCVLQVNASFITIDEVLKACRKPIRQVVAEGGAPSQVAGSIRMVVRDEIRAKVERVLLVTEARKRLGEEVIKILDEQVRKDYRMALAEVDGSKTALVERLSRLGMELGEWLAQMRDGLMIQTHVQRHLASKVHITRPMMLRYYKDHAAEYEIRDRVAMQILLVKLSEQLPRSPRPTEADRRQAVEKARAMIAKALAEIRTGKDFGQVARACSDGPMVSSGGVWPEMDLGSFRAEEVEKAAFAQNVGEGAGPIETSEAIYLVKTLGRRPGGRRTFAQVQDQVTEALRQQQYERLTAAYLSKLREGAMVVGLDRFEHAVLKRVVAEVVGPRE